jgi:hypothetical protein
MAKRLTGQVGEINNQVRVNSNYIHTCMWRANIIDAAVRHLKAKRYECALTTLTDRSEDSDAVLRELAS